MSLRIWNQLGPAVSDQIRAAVADVEVIDLDPRPDLLPDRPAGPPATVLYTQPIYALSATEVAELDTAWAEGVDWVQIPSAGIDKVPPGLLKGRVATCGRGIMSGPIAEFVLAALLARARGIPDVFVDRPTPPPGDALELQTVEGSTIGLLGFGSIGQAIATRALALGAEVIATRRTERPSEVDGVTIVPLDELLERSDSLIVAAPATATTEAILDGPRLAKAKPGVHLVNIARGSLIDQEALLRALDDGIVGHATLDVTAPEPLPDGHPLYTHPRVSISPHVSFAFPELRRRGLDRFLDNLTRYRAGEPLVGLVDLDAGY